MLEHVRRVEGLAGYARQLETFITPVYRQDRPPGPPRIRFAGHHRMHYVILEVRIHRLIPRANGVLHVDHHFVLRERAVSRQRVHCCNVPSSTAERDTCVPRLRPCLYDCRDLELYFTNGKVQFQIPAIKVLRRRSSCARPPFEPSIPTVLPCVFAPPHTRRSLQRRRRCVLSISSCCKSCSAKLQQLEMLNTQRRLL
jgi:hypothetical protein